MVIWELPPGAVEGDHVHEDDDNYEETSYHFLSGAGAIRIDGGEIPLRPGDAFLIPAGVDHGLRNTGSEDLRLLLIFGKPK